MRGVSFLLTGLSLLSIFFSMLFRKPLAGIRFDLFIAFCAIAATLAFIPIFTYAYFAADLKSEENLINKKDTGLVLLDKDGHPFFTFYQAKLRKDIPLSEIPIHTQKAVIAMEDKDFEEHPGFSIKSIIRALFDDIRGKELAYGASTITQQLVKNSLLTPKKDFLRKYQEIVLAAEIERRFDKDKILEMYLNTAYLGEGAFGIEEAALTYFDKHAKDLNLAESSLLAAILPSPSKLSPLNGGLEEAKIRQKIVLEKMVQQGYISLKEKDEAEKEKIILSEIKDDVNVLAPHFAIMVRDQLIEKYGEEEVIRSGFKVKTTLDSKWQKYAQKVVAEQVDKLKPNRVSNGSAVVIDPKTGEIRVLVGSKDWHDEKYGKVNIALSERPSGSSFKPIVYIRAFEKNILSTNTILKDQPTAFANFDEVKYFASYPNRNVALAALKTDPNAFYKPQNYDRKFRGAVTVRKALSNSLNVPAVEVMKAVGVEDTLDFAKKLGLSTLKGPSDYGLSLVLVTADVKLLELTNVYATLANNGQQNTPTSILEIEDKYGQQIYKYHPKNERLIDEKYTFLISSILSDNKARSEMFGNILNISRMAAVKTGTTEDYKDAWTMGYTPDLTIGVWVGNNFGEPMDRVAGSLGAAPIWKSLMEEFLKGTPVLTFEPPLGVVKGTGCGINLSQRVATSSAVTDYFIEGTQPKLKCLPAPNTTPKPQDKLKEHFEKNKDKGEDKED